MAELPHGKETREYTYRSRYCTNCGSLCKFVNGKWKCPNHGKHNVTTHKQR